MSSSDHHESLIKALKKHWAEAGGPVSLTTFLKECRETIDPLLAKNIRWDWIGARIMAVYTDPDCDVSEQLALLDQGKKSLIELYSRTTRRLGEEQREQREQREESGVDAHSYENGAIMDGAKVDKSPEVEISRDLHSSPVLAVGSDPPAKRRARIRRSGQIRLNLEPN